LQFDLTLYWQHLTIWNTDRTKDAEGVVVADMKELTGNKTGSVI